MQILVLNAGSSSQKCALFDLTEPLPEAASAPLWRAAIDWTNPDGAQLSVKRGDGAVTSTPLQVGSHLEALEHLLAQLWQGEHRIIDSPEAIAAVGHRVVHGGPHYREATVIDGQVKRTIEAMAAFAPVHNPTALEGMRAVEQLLGPVLQVALFDTAFHRDLPDSAAVYPGPYEWLNEDIRRYGFHGISYAYCAERAARLRGRELSSLRLIVCHLGNGCSAAAIARGKSVDTTMGFTPLEGLMMGSRSGSVDPSILIYLLRQMARQGQSPEKIADYLDNTLNKASGLKGISGLTSDMRQIVASKNTGNARAGLAFDIYIHRLVSAIAALRTSLDGLDALVFTAGVGENSAEVRAHTCERLAFLGVQLDGAKNQASSGSERDIATDASEVRVLVIPTQEDWAIARECYRLLSASAADKRQR